MRWTHLIAAPVLGGLLMASVARAELPASYLSEDAPDVVFTPAIQAKATELGNDPVRIYEFVRNEFEFQNYFGLMKGADGTLRSKGGNDYDLAALLVSLLRVSGTPARFVRGKIEVPEEEAAAWTGAGNIDAAYNYLLLAQPESWRNNDIIGVRRAAGTFIHRLHVWVEAYVPMAYYRGRASGSDEHGKAWVPLDPSFKLSRWPENPSLPIGSMPDLTFNYYEGENAYYDRVTPKMPHEIFEDQVRGYLASQYVGAGAPLSPDDVALKGSIVSEEPGVLPNGLPYRQLAHQRSGFESIPPPARAARLLDLHNPPLIPDPVVGSGPNAYRYVRSLHFCQAGIPNCDELPLTHPNKLFESSAMTGEWTDRRVTLTFPPTVPSAPHLGPNGYQECEGNNGNLIQTDPFLKVDGVTVGGSAAAVDLCSEVEIVVREDRPLFSGLDAARSHHTIVAGGTYLLGFDSHTASAEQTRAAAEALLAAETLYPIAQDPNDRPFIDSNGNGQRDGGEEYLARHFEAQEALTGGLLHLANSWYYEHTRQGMRRLVELHHQLPVFLPSAGLVSSGRTIHYLFDVPYEVQPSNLLIDIQGFLTGSHHRETGQPPQEFDHLLDLMTHEVSAQEHSAWEELAGLEAVSTVKGFQLLKESVEEDEDRRRAQELLVVRDAQELSGKHWCVLFPCGLGYPCDNQCTWIGPSWGEEKYVDFRTFCKLESLFDIPDAGIVVDRFGNRMCPKLSSTSPVELRIRGRSEFAYYDWQGHVYVIRKQESGGVVSQSMIISPSDGSEAGGGFSVGRGLDPFSPNFLQPPLDLFFGLNPSTRSDFDRAFWHNDRHFQEQFAADPVSVLNGNYYQIDTDLEIAGPGGMNLRLVRSYNSRLQYDGPLGYGWTHTYDQHLRLDEAEPNDPNALPQVVWVDENGAETPWDDDQGELIPREWVHDALLRNGDGSYTLNTKPGMVYQFHPENADGKAQLDFLRDRNGNTITCNYQNGLLASVTDAAGRNLLFHNDQNDRLSEIEDWTGRRWRYAVDQNGDLIEYMDPVETAREIEQPGSGKAWRFSYYSGMPNEELNHNLECWIRPEPNRPATGAPSLCGPEADGHVWMHFTYYSNDTVFKHTDSLGRPTYFSYNYFRKRTDVTHPDGGTETHFYDRYGNVTRFESPGGRVREYDFDAPRRERIAERDGFGFETRAEYDDRGNMTRRVDRLGHAERWTHGRFGQPTSHTDRRGHRRYWDYDSRGNLLRELAEVGGGIRTLAEHRYDSLGNRSQTREFHDPSDGAGHLTRLEYDPAGIGLTRAIDPLGRSTRFTLDDLARPVRTTRTRTVGTRSEEIQTAVKYDGRDRPVRTTDPGGLSQAIVYDANGLTVETHTLIPDPGQSDPQVRVDSRKEYDAMDRLIAAADTLGNTTRHSYDARDRRTHTVSPLGRETHREYDRDGNPIRETDPSGAVWRYEFDAEDRPVRSIDPLGRESRTEYDPEGRVLREFGPVDRLLTEVVEHDENGNPVRIRDAEGREALTVYDELNRAVSVTAALGPPDQTTTLSHYDLAGRLTARTDGEGHTVRLRYDALGRPIETEDALGRKSFASYDEVGNLIESISAAGERVQYRYDSRGALLQRTGPGVSDTYAYDALGRKVLARNGSTARRYEYDDLDRVAIASESLSGSVRQVYDEDGLLRQVVYPQKAPYGFPEGIAAHYAYDARGKLTRLFDPVAGTWHFEYDALGRPVRRLDPAGLERRISYTPEGFVDTVELHEPTDSEIYSYGDHDALGNPQTITTDEGVTQISYDALYRVKTVQYPNAEGTENFQYDRAGNRTHHMTRTGAALRYETDSAHQLLAIHDDASGELIESFEYDDVGRRTSQTRPGISATAYTYNAVGQLTGMSRTDGYAMGLAYDAEGARYSRSEVGEPLARYFGGLVEHRQGESIRLIQAGGLDQVLAEITDSTTRSLLSDAGGNIVRIATDAGHEPEILANGSFEKDEDSDDQPDDWNFFPIDPNHGTLTLDSTRSYNPGGHALLLDVPNRPAVPNDPNTNTLNLFARQNPIPTPEPGSYAASACFYSEGLTGPAQLTVYDPSGGASTVSGHTEASGGWQCALASQVLTVDPNTPYLVAYVRLNEPRAGRVWVDNVRLLRLEDSGQGLEPVDDPARDLAADTSIRRYEAFGTIRNETGSAPVERAFAGRPFEGRSGLINLRARHYDPASGRFLQTDPLGIQADQLYAYAANNPYAFDDPTGLAPRSIASKLGPLSSDLFSTPEPSLGQYFDPSYNPVSSGWCGTCNRLADFYTHQARFQAERGNTLAAGIDAAGAGIFGNPGSTALQTAAGGLAGAGIVRGLSLARGAIGGLGSSQASSALRQRVLSNIGESSLARSASNFEIHLARTSQLARPYGGIDSWAFTSLSRGSLVYGGVPGQSAFYTDLATVSASRLRAGELFQSLQVAPHQVYGYRPAIQAYRLRQSIRVPGGHAAANPHLGAGNGNQLFIRNFENLLEPVRRFHLSP